MAVEKPPLAARNFSWAMTFAPDTQEQIHRITKLPMTFTQASELYSQTYNGYTNLQNQLSTTLTNKE
jgi:hypothetical protein